MRLSIRNQCWFGDFSLGNLFGLCLNVLSYFRSLGLVSDGILLGNGTVTKCIFSSSRHGSF